MRALRWICSLKVHVCLFAGVGYSYQDANFCTLWTWQHCLFRFHSSNSTSLFIWTCWYGSESSYNSNWNSLWSVMLQDPQVVTGSHDTTIKFWDLRYGIYYHYNHCLDLKSIFLKSLIWLSFAASIWFHLNNAVLLYAGKTMSTLTHHKKSVRAMTLHPKEYV